MGYRLQLYNNTFKAFNALPLEHEIELACTTLCLEVHHPSLTLLYFNV